MKNNTIGYNTIVDDTEDKEAGEDHHENDTTTISTKNRRNMFLVVIGVSVSVLVVGMLLFCATSASSALPSSASSLSSFRTAALAAECRPNGDPCFGGNPAALPNGGCCATTTCISNNSGAACALFTDTSCFCHDNPTPPPTRPPTKPPTPPPTHPAPVYYDPENGDSCFSELYARYDNYCWYPTADYSPPVGIWEAVTGRGYDSCGPECPAPPPTPPPTTPVFDPDQDYCFTDTDNPGKYCWYPTNYLPVGRWVGVSVAGHGDTNCGPQCTEVGPYPNNDDATVERYDPSQDFCFKDNKNVNKYCWYPKDYMPCGDWKGEGGHGYDNCGPKCKHMGLSEYSCNINGGGYNTN